MLVQCHAAFESEELSGHLQIYQSLLCSIKHVLKPQNCSKLFEGGVAKFYIAYCVHKYAVARVHMAQCLPACLAQLQNESFIIINHTQSQRITL